jgi:8-oxo-dGTP pyrophosphatase MutT (NUDIX family)
MHLQILAFIREQPTTCANRTNLTGHLTGSAWVLDQLHEYVLLTKHRKLGRWLQLGGHADGEFDLEGVAMREAQEESGLTSIVPGSQLPFDIDVHNIPEREKVPAHFHYDVRFWFTADITEPLVISNESTDLQWISLSSLETMAASDRSLQRMILKTAGLA